MTFPATFSFALHLIFILSPLFFVQLFFVFRTWKQRLDDENGQKTRGFIAIALFAFVNLFVGLIIANVRSYFHSMSDGEYFRSAWEMKIAHEFVVYVYSLLSVCLLLVHQLIGRKKLSR